MPYIESNRRRELEFDMYPGTAGELAYCLTSVIERFVRSSPLRFQTISDVRGALASTVDEFRRKVQDPYEDKKEAANGRIY